LPLRFVVIAVYDDEAYFDNNGCIYERKLARAQPHFSRLT
jgi:hypothetical protein